MPHKTEDTRLLRYLGVHLASGLVAAAIIFAGILFYDIAQIRSLAATSDAGAVALISLGFLLAITFGSVAMGTGIMSLRDDDDDFDY